MGEEIIKSYKGMDRNMKCRDFQYEIGKTYETENADACACGFHACESPLDVLNYYPPCWTCNHGWGSIVTNGYKGCEDSCEELRAYTSQLIAQEEAEAALKKMEGEK